MTDQGRPRLGELLLGTEGLALMRLAFTGEEAARRDRVAEMRDLLDRMDDDDALADWLDGEEHGLDLGYAIWAETYDDRMRLVTVESDAVQGFIDQLPEGAEVLDAACGTARHGAYAASRGHRLTGVDRSVDMLAKAGAKLPDTVFLEGDLEALPVPDAAFDAVLCGLSLVHLPELDRVFAEFARVLRPGGTLIISDIHPMPITLGWQAQFRGTDGLPVFIRLNRHWLSDYVTAASTAGLMVSACIEPQLTAESVRTPAGEYLAEANRQAWVGIPAVVVWRFTKA
ncbi:MAG: class I SAM-dependent methyltransferase [Rhodospirillaceae bacterium]|jgi:ubiquinone/menaquinone biosynthesis C-methylase UbiE|nr:class I SAM-dependent methyltransferase [Rhodospirillaceae bacterium]MBT6202791.1 class I SAM-dependent methyltransferase [Rhodospirillaceae bacterium]MBT6510444.1 class I SAM-dependent methyltransferase [Rhodospirillaceae bacterium]MBT7647779.1 class I SAM-dependent methyltransferase [Rhodospirillaceae bacterium]